MIFTSGMLTDLFKSAGELVGAVLIGIVISYFSFIKNRFSKRSFDANHALNKNMRVRETLSEIRSLMEADRASLYQFHNGEYFVSGDSIQKLSMTHYASKRGVGHPDPNNTRHQNIPVSYLASTLKKIENNPWHTSIEEMPNHYFDKDLHTANGVESMVVAGVRNSRGIFFGVVYVTWFHETPKPDADTLKCFNEKIRELAVDLTYPY